MASVPFTWAEMLVFGEPTMRLEACEICSQIPAYSRNNNAGGVGRLESAGLPEDDKHESMYRCPLCHQLYQWTYSPYEYLAWGSEDEYTTWVRVEARSVFGRLTRHRVADDRFGRALAAIAPELTVAKRTILEHGKDCFPEHCILKIRCGDDSLWIALSDGGEVVRCTLEALASIAASTPTNSVAPAAYVDFIDKVTSEYRYGELIVETFDKIPWRAKLTDEERAYIEELRTASRVEPQVVEQLADRFVVRRWIVAHQKLICRVLTLWPTGVVQREDAVIGEAIPTHVGKLWAYNSDRRQNEPSG